MVKRLHLFLAGCAIGTAAVASAAEPDVDDFSIWEVPDSVPEEITESDETYIMGGTMIDAATMHAFVAKHNPSFPIEIAEAFYRLGGLYGIRADIALCQSILETGWFKFSDGTAVTSDQHNYCGLGVTRRGIRGHCFDTIDDGVRAQLQHLYAYATKAPLPEGEMIIDPRFNLVSRGVACTWHELSNRWAMNPLYGERILSLYDQLVAFWLARTADQPE